jgi:hypothetical protein
VFEIVAITQLVVSDCGETWLYIYGVLCTPYVENRNHTREKPELAVSAAYFYISIRLTRVFQLTVDEILTKIHYLYTGVVVFSTVSVYSSLLLV